MAALSSRKINRLNTTQKTALEEACLFIQEIMNNGPVLARDAERGAQSRGIAMPTLRRAQQQLGIISRPIHGLGQNPPWIWTTPKEPGDESKERGSRGGTRTTAFLSDITRRRLIHHCVDAKRDIGEIVEQSVLEYLARFS